MPETTSSEMRAFQSKVLHEYKFLKDLKGPFPDHVMGSFAGKPRRGGCLALILSAAFPPLLRSAEKYAQRTFSEMPDTIRYSKQSKEILSIPGIRAILCPPIAEKISSDMLVEERDVELTKILTTCLTAKTVDPETWKKFDSRLYAYMLAYIIDMSPENYCATSEIGE